MDWTLHVDLPGGGGGGGEGLLMVDHCQISAGSCDSVNKRIIFLMSCPGEIVIQICLINIAHSLGYILFRCRAPDLSYLIASTFYFDYRIPIASAGYRIVVSRSDVPSLPT